jgi:hypothetical protein
VEAEDERAITIVLTAGGVRAAMRILRGTRSATLCSPAFKRRLSCSPRYTKSLNLLLTLNYWQGKLLVFIIDSKGRKA